MNAQCLHLNFQIAIYENILIQATASNSKKRGGGSYHYMRFQLQFKRDLCEKKGGILLGRGPYERGLRVVGKIQSLIRTFQCPQYVVKCKKLEMIICGHIFESS